MEDTPQNDIQIYSPKKLDKILHAYRKRPNLVHNKTTHLQVPISITHGQDHYSVPTTISILPLSPPPHVRFKCCVQYPSHFSFPLPNTFHQKIHRFLYIEYPHVHWDGSVRKCPTSDSYQNSHVEIPNTLDRVPMTQQTSIPELRLSTTIQDSTQQVIDNAVEKISHGFHVESAGRLGLPTLCLPERLPLKQYSGLLLDHAKKFGRGSKSIGLALGLIEGCVQQILCGVSERSALSDLQTPSEHSKEISKSQLIRWRARASILNAIFSELWPICGFESYRIYDAVIATGYRLSTLPSSAMELWIPIGEAIAKRLTQHLQDYTNSHGCRDRSNVFDPLMVACNITRIDYREYEGMRPVISSLNTSVTDKTFTALNIVSFDSERTQSPDCSQGSDNQSRMDEDNANSITPAMRSELSRVTSPWPNGRDIQQNTAPFPPPISAFDNDDEDNREDGNLYLPLIAFDNRSPYLPQATAAGSWNSLPGFAQVAGCPSSPALDIPSFTSVTGLPFSPLHSSTPGHNTDVSGVNFDQSTEFH